MTMQMAFGFAAGEDMGWVRERLRTRFEVGPIVLRTPIGQLVKSLISGRTRDAVSLDAYNRLIARYPDWSDLARARPEEIEAIIGAVTFADVKARHLGKTLRMIAMRHPDFDLTFLCDLGVTRALEWLERLPGVGRKVAASALNFSTLRMLAFVIDTHIPRMSTRYGIVGGKTDTRAAYDAVMASMRVWRAVDWAELHVLMKRLGQTVCRVDQGCCDECPLCSRCKTAALLSPDGG